MSRPRVAAAAGPPPFARALASLSGLLAFFVVLPVVLIAGSRARFDRANPVGGIRAPWTWTRDEVDDAIRRPIEDDSLIDLVLRLCLVAAWVAVIVVAITTVVETAHLIRHRGLPSPSRRGLGWAQGIARFLATGLVALLPLASPVGAGERLSDASMMQGLRHVVPAESAAAAVESEWTDTSVPGAGLDDRPAVDRVRGEDASGIDATVRGASTTTHVVQRGESVWDIAASLSDGSDADTLRLAEEILESNLGTQMGDGSVFDNPALIQPGWELDVPASSAAVVAEPSVDAGVGGETHPADAVDGRSTHLVEEGETLSSIAEEQLGDSERWVELYDENRGAVMAGGRRFDDPDLILPGWELDLPTAKDAVAQVAELDSDVEVEPVGDVQGDAARGGEADPSDRGGDGGPTAVDHAVLAGVDAAATSSEPQSAGDSGDPAADRRPEDRNVAEVVVDHEAGEVSGDAADPPTGDDQAWSPVASSVSATTSSAPSSLDPAPGAESSEGSSPTAPAPLSIGHAALLAGGVLTLLGVRRRRRLRAALPRARVPEPAPTVATTERSLRNVDAGEHAMRADVAIRAIAHHVVGTGVQIGLVVVGTDGAVTVRLTGNASLPAPWAGAGARWELDGSVPVELLADDARRSGAPCPALVHVGDHDTGALVLLDLEAAGVTTVEARHEEADAVVRSIATNLATSIAAETAHLIGVGLSPSTFLDHPNAMVFDDLAAALHEATQRVGGMIYVPDPTFDLRTRRTGGDAWEPAVVLAAGGDHELAAIPGQLLPDPGRGFALVVGLPDGGAPATAARLRARSDRWELQAFGETVELRPLGLTDDDVGQLVELLDDAAAPLAAAAPSATTTLRTPPSDGDEQADVAFEERPHDVVVTLLGGVSVLDRDGIAGAFERSKTVELIAWLATHPERQTRTAARTALWEIDVRDATFANVVSEARRGLGRLVTPPDGDEWVARTLTDQLPLHELVVTDVQLIDDRLDHARLAAPSHAIDVLRPAVELIDGLPFAGTSYLWPDADGLVSNMTLLATTACAELAAHALALGDIELVFWATQRGLGVLPGHEELIGLRMRAHARAGDLAGVRQEWESYERVITADAWSDGEPAPKLLDLRRTLLTG